MFTIEQKPVPNHGTRGNHRPIAIVDHISIGSRGSVYNTFSNPGGNSSHYLVCRNGEIDQYVDLKRRAHTNGIVNAPKSALVRQMGAVNANYYTVTIEHEGYEGHGLEGDLTEEQFTATCWLHKWIQTEVERLYAVRIHLNSHQVLAHNQIDSKKGTCPGTKFPWTRLYAEFARADTMTLAEYEEDVQYRKTNQALAADAYAFLNRIKGLKTTLSDPRHSSEARRKILLMAPAMADMGLQGDATVESILNRISELESAAMGGGQWSSEGLRKLNIGIRHAKNIRLIG